MILTVSLHHVWFSYWNEKITDGDEQSYIHTCHDHAPELSAWLFYPNDQLNNREHVML